MRNCFHLHHFSFLGFISLSLLFSFSLQLVIIIILLLYFISVIKLFLTRKFSYFYSSNSLAPILLQGEVSECRCGDYLLAEVKPQHFSIFFFNATWNNMDSTAFAQNSVFTLQEELVMCFSNCFCKSEISLKFCIRTSCVINEAFWSLSIFRTIKYLLFWDRDL